MASPNLDLVRSMYTAWGRGDFRSADWADPGIEYVIADGPDPGSSTGLAGLATGWRDFLSVWEELRFEVDEYRELDDERVLALFSFSGHGRASGMEVGHMRAHGACLFHVRDGKVTKVVFYMDRERALADLGLAAQVGTPHA
jgi:ketosteroid isomerase-like protein